MEKLYLSKRAESSPGGMENDMLVLNFHPSRH